MISPLPHGGAVSGTIEDSKSEHGSGLPKAAEAYGKLYASVRSDVLNQRVPTPSQKASSSADEATKTNVAFRLLVDAVQDYAIFILDPDGYVLTWNSGARNIKGYTREEIVGKHFSVFYPKEAVDSHWPERELALAVKEGRFRDEGLRVKKDGSTFWASVTLTALRESDGSLYGFAKVTQDLSARREADERLQALNRELRTRIQQLDESRRVIELRTLELQKLSGSLLQIQDEERRRIARELHDDLAQHVTAVKMEIDASGRGKELSDAMGAILQKIRETSYLLHPPLLDEAGLRAALHWYVDGLMQRSKLQISLSFHPDVLPGVPKEIEMTIFRIIQEAAGKCLSATRRARVLESKSSVNPSKSSSGFAITERNSAQNRQDGICLAQLLGVGITGMRERLRQIGGELSVTRAEPGTLVEATIPLNGADVLAG